MTLLVFLSPAIRNKDRLARWLALHPGRILISLRATVTAPNSECQSPWQCYSCSLSLHVSWYLLSLPTDMVPAGQKSIVIRYKHADLSLLVCIGTPLITRKEKTEDNCTRIKERSRLCSMLVISRLPMTTSQFS